MLDTSKGREQVNDSEGQACKNLRGKRLQACKTVATLALLNYPEARKCPQTAHYRQVSNGAPPGHYLDSE
jgi:hypothetical protein